MPNTLILAAALTALAGVADAETPDDLLQRPSMLNAERRDGACEDPERSKPAMNVGLWRACRRSPYQFPDHPFKGRDLVFQLSLVGLDPGRVKMQGFKKSPVVALVSGENVESHP